MRQSVFHNGKSFWMQAIVWLLLLPGCAMDSSWDYDSDLPFRGEISDGTGSPASVQPANVRHAGVRPADANIADSQSSPSGVVPDASHSDASFTLEMLIQQAVKRNPAIDESRHRWRQTIEKYPQAISLPDPMLTYTYPIEHAMARTDMEKHKITVMQEIPFPHKLYLQGEIVKDDVRIAKLGYERAIRDVVSQVQRTFYEIAYLRSAIEITKRNREVLQHFVTVAQAEVGAGRTPLPDLLRAQSQMAQVSYDLVRLEELMLVEVGQMNALLNRPADTAVSLKQAVFPSTRTMPEFQVFCQHALQHRQEILAARIEIEKSEREVSMAFEEYFPDLSIGFSWAQVERGKGITPLEKRGNEWMLMLGVNLPIWVPKKNARIREAKSAVKSVSAMKIGLENETAAMLKKIYYKATNAKRLVELYQKSLLPQARHSMTIAETLYREGKSSLLGMLEVQNTQLNFSLALTRAQTDYAQSLVELAQISGGTLPVEMLATRKGE